jgi:hypothetical protein
VENGSVLTKIGWIAHSDYQGKKRNGPDAARYHEPRKLLIGETPQDRDTDGGAFFRDRRFNH